MSLTSPDAGTTRARCCERTNRARKLRSPASVIQTAPFSATASSPGSTARSTPANVCGIECAARSIPGNCGTIDPMVFASSDLASLRSSSGSAASVVRTQRPPTSCRDRANCAARSAKTCPRRPARSGRGAGGGAASRSARRISSRLPISGPPLRAEASRGWHRKLARLSPRVQTVVEERAGQDAEREPPERPGQPVEPGVREDDPADLRSDGLFRRQEPLGGKVASPGEKLVMEIDAHGTDVAARSAQARCERQRRMLFRVDARREDRSDRPRHGDAVAVPAAAPVDGAGVQAGTAADAGKRAAELRPGEELAAPMIDDDDVQFAAGPRAVEVGRVGGDGLPRRAPREEPEEDAQVLRARDDLLDAHAGDVQRRKRDAEVGVSFIGADDESARLGNGEIDPREPRLRGEELRAEVLARGFGELFWIGKAPGRSELVVEQLADVLLLEMYGGHHDVARRLLEELHDPLAQIGVDHLDPALSEVRVQVALLGEHRLALHEARDAMPAEDPVDDPVVLVAVARPVDVRTVGEGVALELLEIIR